MIIPKLSRFGRSLKHLTQLFDAFDSDGISLVFLDLGMDTSTSQGRLLRNIMGAFAEYESDIKGDYTRANIRYAIQQGRPVGGRAPFGYINDRPNRTFHIHAEQSEVVRLIFQSYSEGHSQYRVARLLLKRGILTATGLPEWDSHKVGRVLDNPAYAGLQRLDGDYATGNWEPIISSDVWHQVADRRRATREKWSRARGEKRLLAGLMHCQDCGRHANYEARGGGMPGRYKCGRQVGITVCGAPGINSSKADAYVTAAFLERARYSLARGEGLILVAEQWELATPAERRMLLMSVIERVVIEPQPKEDRKPGSAGSTLRIEWKPEPSPVQAPPVNRHTTPTGRARSFAREQLADLELEKQARSERAAAYSAEWRRWRARERELLNPTPK